MFKLLSLLVTSIFLLIGSACNTQQAVKKQTVEVVPKERRQAEVKQTLNFKSLDALEITADYYKIDDQSPIIVLCHQAGWSRGEYAAIAPELNSMGYNCLAIDQRSGGKINGVTNETAKRAKENNMPNSYLDAEIDIIAAVRWAAEKHQKVIVWGSSYSAGLVLKVAQNEKEVDAVLSFSPGDYYGEKLLLKDHISGLNKPTFVTCSQKEIEATQKVFDYIPYKNKTFFKPLTSGNHGSRALWSKFDDSEDYWEAVKAFLKD